jgi:phage gp16-like protein
MPLSRKQYSLIHVAQSKLGIDDDLYRSILANLCGVTSSTELDQAGFELLMGFFEWRGFKPMTRNGPNYGPRPGMASFAQLELIRTLWSEYTDRKGDEASLTKWLERTFKITSPRFLTMTDARKAITALKAMKSRAA